MVDPDATPHAHTPVKTLVVRFVRDAFGVSLRRVCKTLGFHRSTQRYESQKDDADLEGKLQRPADDRPQFGYRRLHVLLRRGGEVVNHKWVYRVYRSLGLAIRKKTRRKGAAGGRVLTSPPDNRNERWSMDFVTDQLASGQRFRVLNVVDDCTRGCVLSCVARLIPGEVVARLLGGAVKERGKPKVLLSDNAPEFTGRALDSWAFEHGIRQEFIEPGKPVQNAYIESFNGRMRDEFLNTH